MKVIKNNYNKQIAVECPHCKSIFIYDDKEDVYKRFGEDTLKCPCCKEQEWLSRYKEVDLEELDNG